MRRKRKEALIEMPFSGTHKTKENGEHHGQCGKATREEGGVGHLVGG